MKDNDKTQPIMLDEIETLDQYQVGQIVAITKKMYGMPKGSKGKVVESYPDNRSCLVNFDFGPAKALEFEILIDNLTDKYEQ